MAKASGKSKGPTQIESTVHQDKRKNIPTEELRNFVAADEDAPPKVLYPRDPSLDPQLVWKGKDEQDSADLEVPVVPVYIQETIHPQALIENLRDTAAAGEAEPELTLFDQLTEIEDFDKRIEFYKHDDKWTNRMILGDSLMVMASLAEKEGLKGKVQMVYLDPPYGIKFGSNWQVSTRKRDVKDGKAQDVTRQPEQVKAFRDTWELGIHSYLSYMRDRLLIARDLLTDSGSVFVQIGDENVHLVRSLLDEVFGSENSVVQIVFKKKSATTPTDAVNDYLLWYARDRKSLKVRETFVARDRPEEESKFNTLISADGDKVRVTRDLDVEALISQGYQWARVNYPIVSQHPSPTRSVDFVWNGKSYSCGSNAQWRFDPKKAMPRLGVADRLFDGGGKSLGGIVFWNDWPYVARPNVWDDLHSEQYPTYVVQTAWRVAERCLLLTTDPGDLVLDPTCGSGTTAYLAEQWGRRWITMDTSRVALALARTRLMTGRFPYYYLADSKDGAQKLAEVEQQIPEEGPFGGDIRRGFVYKTVPHVTLKSIANNPDITDGMSRAEVSAAIAKNADKEVLYDQPHEDKSRLRVTGPFTVESLSPHRQLDPTKEERPYAQVSNELQEDGGQFEQVIIENLKKAGVQNTIKGEKLVFNRLEPYAGKGWLQAEGEFTDTDGNVQRVAVSIGPEHGTVGSGQVKEAAKEAVQGVGFDILVVCGFAFDPTVSEEAKKFGALTVLPTRMNPDLAMGGDLLKKTGSGNLFMIFGEPDLTIKDEGNNMLSVELFGLDVYDPTTGEIRQRSTDDIACWFIDSNYNNEAFFVRHAYFTGADKPYEKLKKALRAEIDEEAWSSLYSTKSRPFPRPTTGQIAVKVINHYGDEVLKVYEL